MFIRIKACNQNPELPRQRFRGVLVSGPAASHDANEATVLGEAGVCVGRDTHHERQRPLPGHHPDQPGQQHLKERAEKVWNVLFFHTFIIIPTFAQLSAENLHEKKSDLGKANS